MDAAQDDWMYCCAGNVNVISQWFLGLFQWFKVVDIGYQ